MDVSKGWILGSLGSILGSILGLVCAATQSLVYLFPSPEGTVQQFLWLWVARSENDRQDFPIAHSAWLRIMASLHSALRINPCKFAASGGMRAGKQPGASRPPWSKHSGLALITNARRRLRRRVNRFCTRCR